MVCKYNQTGPKHTISKYNCMLSHSPYIHALCICNNHIHRPLWIGVIIHYFCFMDKALKYILLCIWSWQYDCAKNTYFFYPGL